MTLFLFLKRTFRKLIYLLSLFMNICVSWSAFFVTNKWCLKFYKVVDDNVTDSLALNKSVCGSQQVPVIIQTLCLSIHFLY
jgi:hypothetical protein